MTQWKTTDFSEYVEVMPIADTKQHNAGDECWCNPTTERRDRSRPLIVHNSVQGEQYTQKQIPGDVDVLLRGAVVNDLLTNINNVTDPDEGIKLINDCITEIKKTMTGVLIEYMEASIDAMPEDIAPDAATVLRRKWVEFSTLLFAEHKANPYKKEN